MESIEVVRLRAPLEDKSLLMLLWHKGSPWLEDIERRMSGEMPGSVDTFLVAYDGDRMAAHVWYTTAARDRRLGLLGHVFTRPEYRRQGLSSRLMRAAMAGFAEEGGQVMQLFTFNPDTVPYYEKLGYETVYSNQAAHGMDWYMRHPSGAASVYEPWFSGTACEVRPLAGGDLPKYCLLYGLEFQTRLKDWAQGIGLGLESEPAFITTRQRAERNEGACGVLDNGQTIVGAAALMAEPFSHQAHIARLDYYLHPAFQDKAGDLLDACLQQRQRLGIEIVYAFCVDDAKPAAFERLGFREKETLQSHYKVGQQRFDGTMLVR